jgi:aminoglycoside phosphotransferase (APT) family kinase protein
MMQYTWPLVDSAAAGEGLGMRGLGEVVARGTRSTVYGYGHGAVAKVPVPSTPDAWIRYEARYAEAAREAGASAPRLLGIEQLAGRTASVWEHAHGPSMWQLVVDRPSQGGALGALLADLQQELFSLVPPVTLPRQRDRLIAKIRRSAMRDPALLRALDLLPEPTPDPRLCHGDLHPSNVIMAREGPVLVDWFDAARGDPVADAARSSLVLLSDGITPPSHLPGADRSTLGAFTDAYLARLAEALEFDDDLLTRWRAIGAAARLAEGVPPGPLLDVWRAFVAAEDPA